MPTMWKPLLASFLISGLTACGGSSSSSSGGSEQKTPEFTVIDSQCENGLNASAGSLWCWSDPAPQGNSLNGFAIANGEYFFVGSSSTLMFSDNLSSWNNLNLYNDISSPYYAASYANGTWVASTPGGVDFTTDKVNWETDSAIHFSSLDHHYGNGRWVSVGIEGDIATSSDAKNWEVQRLNIGYMTFFESVYFGNELWVIVGDNGSIYTSKNGQDWENKSLSKSVDFTDVIYVEAEGLWVATAHGFMGNGSSIYSSTNGIFWQETKIDISFGLEAIAYHGGYWIALGTSSKIYRSQDLTNWTRVDPLEGVYSSENRYLHTIEYVKDMDMWVAVGDAGRIATSRNGVDWTFKVNTNLSEINAIAINELDQHVAVGSNNIGGGNSIQISDDGITWEVVGATGSNILNDVKYANGTWRAVGIGGDIYHSTDRRTWIEEDSGTYEWLQAIDFDPITKRWIAVGWDGIILTLDEEGSQSGQWLAQNSGVGVNLNDVHFDGQQWVVVGDDSTFLISSSGTIWTVGNLDAVSDHDFTSVEFAQGKYIAVGSVDATASSTDGQNWVYQDLNFGNASEITFADGQWRVASAVGGLFESSNGRDWDRIRSADLDFSAVARSTNKWIAAGKNGQILFKAD